MYSELFFGVFEEVEIEKGGKNMFTDIYFYKTIPQKFWERDTDTMLVKDFFTF